MREATGPQPSPPDAPLPSASRIRGVSAPSHPYVSALVDSPGGAAEFQGGARQEAQPDGGGNSRDKGTASEKGGAIQIVVKRRMGFDLCRPVARSCWCRGGHHFEQARGAMVVRVPREDFPHS